MQAFCSLLTAATLLFHTALGGCQCWHEFEPSAGLTAQALPCDCCCPHGQHNDRQRSELPGPCECCMHGPAVCAFLSTQKTTVDAPSDWVAYQPAEALIPGVILESMLGHNAPNGEIAFSLPPLYLVYQVFLI